MGGIGSLVDLLLFHSHERAFFNRLVVSMGKNPQLVKKVIALWLMLEEVGYHDLIRRIHSVSETTIEAIFEEALQCLECIQPNAAEPIEESNYSTPFFVQLLDEPVNLMFFRYNRKFIYKRYEHVMKTVCNKIFGEKAAIEVVDVMHSVPVISSIGEGSSAQGSTLNISESSIEAPKQSNLNPGATEFYHFQIATQESRALFLTLSIGQPLTKEEIVNFFTMNWGQVVEDVYVDEARLGRPPVFGKVIFTSAFVVAIILHGQDKAKFVVNRRHLWARAYVPRGRRRRTKLN